MSYGDPMVNECMEYLEKAIGGPPQKTKRANRGACKRLLNCLGKMYPEEDKVLKVKQLIYWGLKTQFWVDIKDFVWLADNYLVLIDIMKLKFPPKNAPKVIKLSDGSTVTVKK